MSQHYSDPKRESLPYSLPDVEVCYTDGTDGYTDDVGEPLASGWYWVACFPGCLPDGEPVGPFETEAEAIADAQSN